MKQRRDVKQIEIANPQVDYKGYIFIRTFDDRIGLAVSDEKNGDSETFLEYSYLNHVIKDLEKVYEMINDNKSHSTDKNEDWRLVDWYECPPILKGDEWGLLIIRRHACLAILSIWQMDAGLTEVPLAKDDLRLLIDILSDIKKEFSNSM
jgi:hypothetical protein